MERKKAGTVEVKGHEAAGMMRWLLTYADMITLLFALAILLYSIANIDAKKYEKVARSVRVGFGGSSNSGGGTSLLPGGSGILPGGSGFKLGGKISIVPPIGEFAPSSKGKAQVEKELRPFIGKYGNIKIVSDERGIVVQVFEGKPMYQTGKADLNPTFIKLLSRIATIIKSVKNPVRIEGHTDNVPIHNEKFPSNWELSAARAINVLRFFVEKKNIPARKLCAVGYADTHAIAANDTPAHRALNRRVEIVILKGRVL